MSNDLSAITATSSNSESSNVVELRRTQTQGQIRQAKIHSSISIIRGNADGAGEVNFKELLMNNTVDLRKDRLLSKQIKKIFADGIKMEDPLEECSVRQSAYCFSLGLSPEFLREKQSSVYRNLLALSNGRSETHKRRIDEFKKANPPNTRLPLDNCCGDQTHMCRVIRQIKKDVPRTTSTFENE